MVIRPGGIGPTSSIALALFALVILGASPLRAETSGRAHFEAGVEAFEVEDYERARVEFQAAFDADRLPAVLYNIAMCQRALQMWPESINSFRRYLEEASAQVEDAERGEIARLVEEMRPHVGDVVFRVSAPRSGLPSPSLSRRRSAWRSPAVSRSATAGTTSRASASTPSFTTGGSRSVRPPTR